MLAAVLSCVAGDGLNDCYIIESAGTIKEYRMTGTNINPAFTLFPDQAGQQRTSWYGIDVGDGAVSCLNFPLRCFAY